MNIKKYLLFLLLLPMFSAAQAQENTTAAPADDNTFPNNLLPKKALSRFSAGVFAGKDNNHHDINTWYAVDMKYTDLQGYTAGVSFGYHPNGWFSLHTDVAMVQKNYRMDRDNMYISFVYTESTNNYLSVPVTAMLSVGRTVRLCGYFGGYAGYWLSAHRKGQSYPTLYVSSDDEVTFFDQDYEFNTTRDNRFDAGLVYGAGLRCAIVKKIDLSIEVKWYYALTDIQKAYTRNINPRYNTTRAIQFGAAYWF